MDKWDIVMVMVMVSRKLTTQAVQRVLMGKLTVMLAFVQVAGVVS